MATFKYSLDKSSKKHICPNCNKNTFVYYVDTVKGEYLPTDFGRCDREQNCGYHKAPSKGKRGYLIPFLTLKNISDKASKLVDVNGVISMIPNSQILEQNQNSCFVSEWYLKTSTINYLNSESKFFNRDTVPFLNQVVTTKPPEPIKPSYHSTELVDKLINQYNKQKEGDNLTTFLLNNFTFDEVDKAISDYYLTGTNHFWENSTIFWQMDTNEQIRGAKIMLYNKHTGKRVKEPYNHINWLHKAIKEPNFNLCQCLFGLHLIHEDCQKNIAIVESEKTAIVMSIYLPDFIWLATGSKSNFKFELLEPLKKRKCFAFPDKGEFTNWNNKAKVLKSKGFKIEVSNLLEQASFKNGFDLADYYLE
jgi:hypothetical protein